MSRISDTARAERDYNSLSMHVCMYWHGMCCLRATFCDPPHPWCGVFEDSSLFWVPDRGQYPDRSLTDSGHFLDSKRQRPWSIPGRSRRLMQPRQSRQGTGQVVTSASRFFVVLTVLTLVGASEGVTGQAPVVTVETTGLRVIHVK